MATNYSLLLCVYHMDFICCAILSVIRCTSTRWGSLICSHPSFFISGKKSYSSFRLQVDKRYPLFLLEGKKAETDEYEAIIGISLSNPVHV